MRLPVVAVVGRPNVGKSTLFNRIVGHRLAIVSEESGVTRDRLFAEANWAGRRFLLTDTGGVVESPEHALEEEIRRQALLAVDHADVILFVADGRAGVHPSDRYMADLLRRSGRPVILAVNKLDELAQASGHLEFYALGLGEPVPVSALSGKGSGDLLDRVVATLPDFEPAGDRGADLDLAVIGKPNVGKSSFVNRLLGEERLIVDERSGTTRDAVDTFLTYGDHRIRLIDTAGLRRRSRVEDALEFYSRVRATAAIRRADVCLLLVDTAAGVTNQDFHVGQAAWDAGCGLVLVANKWDLIPERGPKAVAAFERELRDRAAYLRWVPMITTSALTGQRVRKVLDIALRVQEHRRHRVPTAEVNRVLRQLVARRQPPQGRHGDVRLPYASQVAASPPLFVLWANRPEEVASHYLRYLENGFRRAWNFEGTPIRLKLRKRETRR